MHAITRRTVLGAALGAGAIGMHGRRVRTEVSVAPGAAPIAPFHLLPPMEVAPGRPPQLIIVSFDGSADNQLMRHWRSLAEVTKARFTFFVSGTYLLLRPNAARYQAPRHRAGVSDIGFFPVPAGADPAAELADVVGQLGAAHLEGHEIGTHYNGHFCGRSSRAVGAWDKRDWQAELDQFHALAGEVGSNNGLTNVTFPETTIVGGRTPCLEGDLSVLYPVLAANGFRYDASDNAPEGTWPRRRCGLWSFPLHAIPLAGTRLRVLAMDYNLYANQSGAKPVVPAAAGAIRAQALQTYRDYFSASYRGTRAPMTLGHHFTRWNHGAYVDALTQFIQEVAIVPDVHLVTYRTACEWLDARALGDLHPGAQFARS